MTQAIIRGRSFSQRTFAAAPPVSLIAISCFDGHAEPGVGMRRRDFITGFAGLAAAWPLAARAQQQRVRLVGMVSGFNENEMRPLLAAFRARLNQLGWSEGDNLTIDARLGAGDYTRMSEAATQPGPSATSD